jgi:NAD(P)-dependent dehydrogenase (short-subunit alcohol dehydrogenase family)
MDLRLGDKRVLIVGGSRGIGRATALQLAREGAAVAIAARGAEVEQVAEALAEETGGRVIGVRLDSRDEASVRAGVGAVIEAFGGVDVLICTAADPWTSDKNRGALETDPAFLLGEVDTKVAGYLRVAQAVLPGMRERRNGRILLVSGFGARLANTIAQTVRNIGVSALAKNLADEFGPEGISAVVVHPGATRTEAWEARAAAGGPSVEQAEADASRNSLRRPIDASEVADVLTFLASPRSESITGDAVAAGGGLPGFVSY